MREKGIQIEVPGFPGRVFELPAAIGIDPELVEVVKRNCQPDVFEQLLIADGRLSEKRLQRYRKDLRLEGWQLNRQGEWRLS